MKVQSFKHLIDEMKTVAKGEAAAPPGAALPSVESADVLVRLLTTDNRALLLLIEQKHPQSIVELERLSGRKGPNLTRTLSKLEAAGLVRLDTVKRRKVPRVVARQIVIRIDPCRNADEIAIV